MKKNGEKQKRTGRKKKGKGKSKKKDGESRRKKGEKMKNVREVLNRSVKYLLKGAASGKKMKSRRIAILRMVAEIEKIEETQEKALKKEYKGVVYVLFDRKFKFYIGSTVRLVDRCTEHQDAVKEIQQKQANGNDKNNTKVEKKVTNKRLYKHFSLNEMFCIALRGYNNEAQSRVSENGLIAAMNPDFNIIKNDGFKEVMKQVVRNRKRRRPGAWRRKQKKPADDHPEPIEEKYLTSAVKIAKVMRKRQSYQQVIAQKKKHNAADINMYLPQNYDVLAAWLGELRTKLDGDELEKWKGKGVEFPIYSLRRTVQKLLSKKRKEREMRKIKIVADMRGVPTAKVIKLYWRYTFGKAELMRLLKQITKNSHPEIQRVIKQEMAIRMVRIMYPRQRLLALNSISVARKMTFQECEDVDPSTIWEKVEVIGSNMAKPLPPIDNDFLEAQGRQLLMKLKKNKVLRMKIKKHSVEREDDFRHVDNDSAVHKKIEMKVYKKVCILADKNKNKGYEMDENHYKRLNYKYLDEDVVFKRVDNNRENELKQINENLEKDLPKNFRIQLKNLPYIYYNFKDKCRRKKCKKPQPHQCGRKIVSCKQCFSSKDRKKVKRIGKTIENVIEREWSHREVKSTKEGKELIKEEFENMKPCKNCSKCGKEKANIGIRRSTWDATSFFEQLPLEILEEACAELKMKTSVTDAERKCLDFLMTFTRHIRSATLGIDRMYRMAENRGTFIGGLLSKVVASLVLCFYEDRGAEEITKAGCSIRRYVDDSYVMSQLCRKCESNFVTGLYGVPMELELTNDGDDDVPVEWLDMNIRAKCGKLRIVQVNKSDPLTRIPPFGNVYDADYGAAVFRSFIQAWPDDVSVLATVVKFQVKGWPMRLIVDMLNVIQLKQVEKMKTIVRLLAKLANNKEGSNDYLIIPTRIGYLLSNVDDREDFSNKFSGN